MDVQPLLLGAHNGHRHLLTCPSPKPDRESGHLPRSLPHVHYSAWAGLQGASGGSGATLLRDGGGRRHLPIEVLGPCSHAQLLRDLLVDPGPAALRAAMRCLGQGLRALWRGYRSQGPGRASVNSFQVTGDSWEWRPRAPEPAPQVARGSSGLAEGHEHRRRGVGAVGPGGS